MSEQQPENSNTFWPNHLASLINEARVAKGWTVEELAIRAGFGPNREKITTILRGNWPHHSTLVKVIGLLSIAIEQVYPLPAMPTTGQLLKIMRMRTGLRLNDIGAAVGISGSQVRRIERDLAPKSPSIPLLRAFFAVENMKTYENDELPPLALEMEYLLEARGLSIVEAAAEARIDAMTLRLILRGYQPSRMVMKRLEEKFGISPYLVRPLDPSGALDEQLRTQRWHSGLTTREFAAEIGLSSSSYATIVANGVIGERIYSILASAPITLEAAQRARSRHIKRKLEESSTVRGSTSLLGTLIDQQCIELGVLPGVVAPDLSLHPSNFRQIRRGRFRVIKKWLLVLLIRSCFRRNNAPQLSRNGKAIVLVRRSYNPYGWLATSTVFGDHVIDIPSRDPT